MPTNHPIRRTSPFAPSPHLEGLESRTLLSGSGLAGQYFNNDDFTNPALNRVESINFDWNFRSPSSTIARDTFSVRWAGLIEPQTTGTHTLFLTADDSARLWIDGKLIIDAWNNASGTQTGTFDLVAGKKVGIKIEYRQTTGDAYAKLEWAGPNLARQVVPADALYQQQKSNQPLRIIALGDSVTEGDVNHASYRFWLEKKLRSAGYSIDLVGLRSGGHVPNVGSSDSSLYSWFDQDHQSRWGGDLDELQAAMPQWAALNPQVALIHIGHNDIRGGETPQQLIANLGRFIDDMRSRLPDIKIALAKPITNYSLGHVAEMDAYRAMIPALVAQKTTARSPIVLVDQADGFNPATDTYDTVHPNQAGEQKMARKFFTAIQSLVGPADLKAVSTTPVEPGPTTPVFASLTGFVFNDANANGTRDPDEPGLPGRFVYLDFNNNAKRDGNEPIVVTSPTGRYLFKQLPAGNYRVRHHVGFAPLAGTSPTNHQHIARLGAINTDSTYDFGVRSAVATLAGNFFNDANANGQRDANEKGVTNRYVFLDANNNGVFDKTEKFAVTDSNGDYLFQNLPPGLHRVRPFIGPAIRVTTPSTWAYWVNLTPGDQVTGKDLGLAMR